MSNKKNQTVTTALIFCIVLVVIGLIVIAVDDANSRKPLEKYYVENIKVFGYSDVKNVYTINAGLDYSNNEQYECNARLYDVVSEAMTNKGIDEEVTLNIYYTEFKEAKRIVDFELVNNTPTNIEENIDNELAEGNEEEEEGVDNVENEEDNESKINTGNTINKGNSISSNTISNENIVESGNKINSENKVDSGNTVDGENKVVNQNRVNGIF